MRKIITLLVGVLYLSTNLFSQMLDYDNNSRWFWGLNAGGTWHTSDVQVKTGLGLGLIVGRSFNYDYGRKISFDVRGRALLGDWRGQDRKQTDFTVPNETLSAGETNYNDSLGFAYRNFSSFVSRLSLELVIHLNSVKERTRFDPYVFGGIGYSWYRAKGNYLKTEDGDSKMYDYASWDEGLTNGQYLAKQDDSYETILDGSSSGKKNVKLMPSLGFGLGYQIAPRFTAGFEHKTTFTGYDIFDGVVDQGSSIKNDWYHYTSLYLRFYVRRSKKNETNSTVHTNNNPPNRNDNMQPPVVQFTNPPTWGTTTTLNSYNVRADVKNVYNKQDITFVHNGREVKGFNFSPSTGKFDIQVVLIEGENNFEITGNNVYGTDRKSTNLIMKKPDPLPPLVSFQNPPTSPITVSSNTFELDGAVLNVDQKNQVRLEVNGREQTNFTFNTGTKKTRATLNLNLGTNVVQLTGTNEVGTDSKTTIIIYQRDFVVPNTNTNRQPPVVYFVNPSISPYTSNATTMTLDAKVLHVLNKQNVTFKQNGQVNYNFTFNTSSKDFRSTVSLVNGQNVFEIIGSNQDGSAQATAIIIYERAAYNPPIVTINTPNANPYNADNENLNFSASVLNVSSKNQVEVKVNGQPTNNFTFNNSTVNANIRLANGTTVIDVKGTNQDGTDQKQTTVIYRKPTVQNQNPPTVYFVNPANNPFTTNVSNITLDAKAINVLNKQNVTFKHNGQINNNFTFNTSNKDFRSSVTLNYGQNVFEIIGTNQDGTSQATTVVIYERTAKNPPVVTITNPSSNPYSTDQGTVNFNATVLNVSAKNQVEVKVNGQVTTNFSFNNATVSATIPLGQGSTVIDVKGTNQDGVDQKQTTVNYRKPVAYTPKPPVVTITKPTASPYNSDEPKVMFIANVLNVSSRDQIEVKVNGQVISDFFFINSTVSREIALVSGTTTIDVKATNQDGSDQKSTTVVYRIPTVVAPAKPPVVTITSPAFSPFVTSVNQVSLKATVLNVTSKKQVEVKVNGQAINNFTFNNSVVQANIAIEVGTTIVEVKGTNQDGVDQKETKVTYRKPLTFDLKLQKPIVEFVNPSSNPVTTKLNVFNAIANVSFVSDESGVEVKVNGVKITRVGFNSATGALNFSASLKEGSNTVMVKGTNPVGSDSKTTTIIYAKDPAPVQDKPVVVFTNPLRCPASFEEGPAVVKGNISNVTSQQQVVFKVAGQIIKNATSVMNNGKLEFSLPISVGGADLNIQVTATNSAGSDVKSCLIKPIKPAGKSTKPTVKPVVKPTPTKPKAPVKVPAKPTVKPTIVAPNTGRTGTVTPKP